MDRAAENAPASVLVSDLEVDETEATEDEFPDALRFEIASYPADYTVKVLVQKWLDGQLEIPDFQRAYVWTLPQASRLIESFLLGLPVPQVFLYKERGSSKLLVVDGQQRLATLAQFYDGVFMGNRVFRLTGVSEPWQGKRYSDLDEDDRLRLDDSPLRSIVVQQLTPDDNESIYMVFERLNTGGTQLNPMEVRKSVFHGRAFGLVSDLNRDASWRRLIGQPNPDRRLKDVELLLRVLALGEGWTAYSKPMKTFLTTYMERLVAKDDDALQALARSFASAARVCAEGLPDRPFHLRGRLNVAALDSFVAGVLATDHRDAGTLGSCYAAIVANEEFRQAAFFNTSDADVLRSRFQIVTACLTPGG